MYDDALSPHVAKVEHAVKALREELRAILQKAIDERRPDLSVAEAARWDTRYAELCRLRGETTAPVREQSGDGWRLSSDAPHADLERLAREIRAVAFRLPWPEGWSVKFGELTGQHAGLSAVTLYREKLIIIDQMKARQRGEDDLRESVLHELVHVACGWDEDCATSHLFHITLNDARARTPRVIPAWTSTAW